jgi:glycosidase
MYAAAFYLLRGIPFLYQGQEFGFANPYYSSIADFQDIETLEYYRANAGKKSPEKLLAEINYGSRDNTRRPMAWTTNENAGFGFSTGKPWLPYHSRAKELNAEKDKNAEKSVFEFYRKLLSFRQKSEIIRRGSFRDLTPAKDCFVYERTKDNKRVIVVCNFRKNKKISPPKGVNEQNFSFVFSNYRDYSPFSEHFRPFEIAVYEEK